MPPLNMCRYNGVIPYNMPFNKYPYRFRIDSVSFSYCSPIEKRKQYGNDTESNE